MFDGFKTYIGIGVTLLSAIQVVLNPHLISVAVGADDQWSAIISIAFLSAGALLSIYGRIDAQRKIEVPRVSRELV